MKIFGMDEPRKHVPGMLENVTIKYTNLVSHLSPKRGVGTHILG